MLIVPVATVLSTRVNKKLSLKKYSSTDYIHREDHCIYISLEKKSWVDAQKFCNDRNSSLVTIDNEMFNNIIDTSGIVEEIHLYPVSNQKYSQ
jgi:hypothetical protein